MSPAELHFLRPEWLWLFLPLAWLAWRLLRASDDVPAWRPLVDAHLLPRLLRSGREGGRRVPVLLLCLAWLLVVLALAGPTWERLPQPVYQAQQHRVVLLDLSPTMNAPDLPPSRLVRARFEVLDLLRLSQDGQTALIVYAAEPFTVAPLTTDTETIAVQVPSLESALLPVSGPRRTDLALDEAGRLLAQAGASDGEVVLVTDGLDNPAAANAAAARLATQGHRLAVLGVGTSAGAPVPAPGGGYLKDRQGAVLVPKLDDALLQALAVAGNGRYRTAIAGDADLLALLPLHRPSLAQDGDPADAQAEQWREVGPWLLLLVLPIAALAFRRGWISPLLLAVALPLSPDAYAFDWTSLWSRQDQRAMQRFEAGDAAGAAALFRRDDWRAAAAYASGDYERALGLLDEAAGAGAGDPVNAYNRGNALARLGQLEDALAAYDQALAVDPENADARHNRDLVQALLDRRRAAQPDSTVDASRQQTEEGATQETASDAESQSDSSDDAVGAADDDSEGSSDDTQAQLTAGEDGTEEETRAGDQQSEQESGQDGEAGESSGRRDSAASAGDRPGEAAGDAPDRQDDDGAGPEQGPESGNSAEDIEDTGGKNDAPPERRDDGSSTPDQQAQTGEAGDGQSRSDDDLTPAGEATTNAVGKAADAGETASGEAQQAGQGSEAGPSQLSPATAPRGEAPSVSDLLQLPPDRAAPSAPGGEAIPGLDREGQQALEQMLRRVEDDPSGLLRQRFQLQYLRRHGRLP
jgi:Ca-activated chloride channel family protein